MDLTLSKLENKKLTDLYKLAKEYQVTYYSQMKKRELIFAILKAVA
jgi:transcription termination factor Rho